MDFFELHAHKAAGHIVAHDKYNQSIDDLVSRLSPLIDSQLRKQLQISHSLQVVIDPLIYLVAYQKAAAALYPEQSIDFSPDNIQPLVTLEQVFQINLDSAYGCLLRSLRGTQCPFDFVRDLLQNSSRAQQSESLPKCDVSMTGGSNKKVLVTIGLLGIERLYLKLALPAIKIDRAKRAPPCDWCLPARLELIEAWRDQQHPLSRHEIELLAFSALVLPTAYFESCAELYRGCADRCRSASAILMGAEFMRRPEVALSAALIKSKGGKLMLIQHGGFYGQTDPTCFERAEERMADTYFTWGYKYHPGHLPVPSMKLSKIALSRLFRKTASAKNKKLLLVAPFFTTDLGFATHSTETNKQFEAFNASLELIRPLVEENYSVCLRFHPRNEIESLLPHIPALANGQFEVTRGQRGELVKDALDYECVVFSSPNATGICECLAGKVPFVIAAAPKYYWLQDGALPFYEALIQEGVWITGPLPADDLAKRLRTNFSSAGITKFSNNFALCKPNYLKHWARAIAVAKH